VQYKCGKRVRQRGCTETPVRVLKDTSYCRQCYRNHPGVDSDGIKMSAKQKKSDCRQSCKGCAGCEEPICKLCWPTYDHRPST
jgi:hypothetical protein